MNESLKAAVLDLEAIAMALFKYQAPTSGDTCEEYMQRLEYVTDYIKQSILGE